MKYVMGGNSAEGQSHHQDTNQWSLKGVVFELVWPLEVSTPSTVVLVPFALSTCIGHDVDSIHDYLMPFNSIDCIARLTLAKTLTLTWCMLAMRKAPKSITHHPESQYIGTSKLLSSSRLANIPLEQIAIHLCLSGI
eukprot:2385885-Amphidinium_carterae.1